MFDGGNQLPSTKDTTHLRRTNGKKGKQVRFDKEMKFSIKKDDFLLKISNKPHFLEMLTEKMNEGPISAVQAFGDADRLIVSTALDLSKNHPVAIIGEDDDLLVHCIMQLMNMITVGGKLGKKCEYMAVVHDILECDTK